MIYQLFGIKIRRFKELTRRNVSFLEGERKCEIKASLGILPNIDLNIVLSKMQELNSKEEMELVELQNEIGEFAYLDTHNLKIEQWSFFKLLHPKLDNETLFKIISQFSKDYISQLNFNDTTNESISKSLGIKDKYIHHCKLITQGFIQFV